LTGTTVTVALEAGIEARAKPFEWYYRNDCIRGWNRSTR
jgi:hypothetical protein